MTVRVPPVTPRPAHSKLVLSIKVVRGAEVPWDSTLEVPVGANSDPRPVVDQWMHLMESALAYMRTLPLPAEAAPAPE